MIARVRAVWRGEIEVEAWSFASGRIRRRSGGDDTCLFGLVDTWDRTWDRSSSALTLARRASLSRAPLINEGLMSELQIGPAHIGCSDTSRASLHSGAHAPRSCIAGGSDVRCARACQPGGLGPCHGMAFARARGVDASSAQLQRSHSDRNTHTSKRADRTWSTLALRGSHVCRLCAGHTSARPCVCVSPS